MQFPFHVHVYFQDDSQREQALGLRQSLSQRFPRARLGRIHERAVHFHAHPMYQVAFEDVDLGTLVGWLNRHRRGLSVMVHPVIGDRVEEHLEQSIWLGRPLELDVEKLRASRSTPNQPVPASKSSQVILRIDASARHEGSQGRLLADELVDVLLKATPDAQVVRRDLADGVALLDSNALEAWSIPIEDRSPRQIAAAEPSDAMVAELQSADALVIALPIYNFHVPAAFKAWIDLVARSGLTFNYTADGPVGILPDRPVFIVMTSGGTKLGGPLDFITPWLKHVLSFIGLHDVRIIAADGMMMDASQLERARSTIAELRVD